MGRAKRSKMNNQMFIFMIVLTEIMATNLTLIQLNAEPSQQQQNDNQPSHLPKSNVLIPVQMDDDGDDEDDKDEENLLSSFDRSDLAARSHYQPQQQPMLPSDSPNPSLMIESPRKHLQQQHRKQQLMHHHHHHLVLHHHHHHKHHQLRRAHFHWNNPQSDVDEEEVEDDDFDDVDDFNEEEEEEEEEEVEDSGSNESRMIRSRRGNVDGSFRDDLKKSDQNIYSGHENQKLLTILLPTRVKKPLIEAHQHQIYSDVNAVDGRLTRLPCFVRPLGPSDSISLVLWYRGDDISGSPIYSVDARHQPFERGQHFIHSNYQHKQMMNFTLNNISHPEKVPKISSKELSNDMLKSIKPISKSTAHLYVMPVEEKDAGLYWCRVDYKWERTTISTVTLNVIVPPRQLQILSNLVPSAGNNSTINLKTLAPNETLILNEDESATLICLSQGGKPLPILNWFRDDELIRKQIFHILTEKNHTLQSELHLTPISAMDHNRIIKCLSSNDNNTFLSSQIHLQINTKPSRVEIAMFTPTFDAKLINSQWIANNDSAYKPLMSGEEITIKCRSYGSRPPANHTMYLMPGHKNLVHSQKYIIVDSNGQPVSSSEYIKNNNHGQNNTKDNEIDGSTTVITESVTRLVVQAEDNDHWLVCRSENGLLGSRSVLENRTRLDIAFAPKVSLHQIDVRQQSIKGNNNSVLASNMANGLVIRGQSLMLQCNITANPSVTEADIFWYKDSKSLKSIKSSAHSNSVLGSNKNEFVDDDPSLMHFTHNGTRLVVPKVTEDWQGSYQCVGKNGLGTGFSNHFQVQVLYEPHCVTPMQTIPANINNVVTLICEVESNPTNVTFYWRHNRQDLYQGGIHSRANVLPARHQSNRISKNRIEVRIESPEDYGQYQCWASNLAGDQLNPCYYNVYENSIKHQLICDTDISHELIRVDCQPTIYASNTTQSDALNLGMINSGNQDGQKHYQESKIYSEQKGHHTLNSVVHYNLKIFKNKRQLINMTSIEPKFLIHFNELEIVEGQQSGTPAADAEMPTTVSETFQPEVPDYLMFITAQLNGRSISDINLSFGVPKNSNRKQQKHHPSESSSSSLVNHPMVDNDNDDDDDDDDELLHLDSSLWAHDNLSTISRFKKISPSNDQQQQRQPQQMEKTMKDKKITPQQNIASFHRTNSLMDIGHLPIIWIIVCSIVLLLLVSLLVALIIKVNLGKQRRKKQQKTMPGSDGKSSENAKTVRFDNDEDYSSSMVDAQETLITGVNNYQDNLFSSDPNELRIDDKIDPTNINADSHNHDVHHPHASIKLFTLTNFHRPTTEQQAIYSFATPHQFTINEMTDDQPKDLFNSLNRLGKLPDLMMDTLAATSYQGIQSTKAPLCSDLIWGHPQQQQIGEEHHNLFMIPDDGASSNSTTTVTNSATIMDQQQSGDHDQQLINHTMNNYNSGNSFIYVTLTDADRSSSGSATVMSSKNKQPEQQPPPGRLSDTPNSVYSSHLSSMNKNRADDTNDLSLLEKSKKLMISSVDAATIDSSVWKKCLNEDEHQYCAYNVHHGYNKRTH